MLWNGLPLEVRQLTSPSIFKGKLRDKFRLTNNLISDILFLHTVSLKSRCFPFIFIILVFILDVRLVRKLVFLYFNENVYLKEIPCLNKVTLPYLTLPICPARFRISSDSLTSASPRPLFRLFQD